MVVDSRPEEYDEDQDSLFGTPPSSPRIVGRPESPGLAFPRTCTSQGADASRMGVPTSAPAGTQNVGTIALPGSQHHSELPINPLALSLNHGVVSRPPAMPTAQVAQTPAGVQASSRQSSWQSDVAPIASTSTSAHPVAPASGSTSTSMGKKKRSRRPSPSEEEPATPRGLEFTLPDPTAPPPAHFLRNQDNLLGKAGRVGGVKPATLTHTRGSTLSNPILVDDEDTPMIGRHNRQSLSQEYSKCHPYIDSSLLTAPTNQEIVQVLIGQKDIFPVLESILKLVMGAIPTPRSNSPLPPTGFERRPPQAPPQTNATSDFGQPVKKRRLNRVPAGAADWDVPYPFEKGEGPAAYQTTWERDRGKQLVAELIKLIKTAARKAATKKYLVDQDLTRRETAETDGTGLGQADTTKANSYYRPETFTYGLEGKSTPTTSMTRHDVHDVLRDASNANHVGKGFSPGAGQTAAITPPTTNPATPSGISPVPTNFLPSSEFDGSFSSLNLFEPLQGQQVGSSGTQFIDLTGDQPALPQDDNAHSLPIDGSVPQPFDQNAFDTWMNFLETFPMPFDPTAGLDFSDVILTPGSTTETTVTPSISYCSTPGLDDLIPPNLTSDDLAALLSMSNQPTPHPLPNFDVGIDGSLPSFPMHGFDFPAQPLPSTVGDHLIDPDLLAISTNNANSSTNVDFAAIMNLSTDRRQSPIASTSSFTGSLDPATPASAGWDTSFPDVFEGNAGGMASGGQGDGGIPMDLDNDPHSFGVLPELPELEKEPQVLSYLATALDKGKGKETGPIPLPTTIGPSTVPPATQKAFRSLLGLQTNDEHFAASPGPFAASSSTATSSRLILQRGSMPARPEPSLRQVRKDEIIRRAQEKRQQLKEELDAVKNQLWATTVEQAALIHLLRKVDGVDPESGSSQGASSDNVQVIA